MESSGTPLKRGFLWLVMVSRLEFIKGRVLAEVGSSWCMQLNFMLYAYFRPLLFLKATCGGYRFVKYFRILIFRRSVMKMMARIITLSLLPVLLTGMVQANELTIYPAKDQSAEQQEKDKFECYSWAKNDSGFDPMAVPKATTPAPTAEKKKGGAVKGAAVGAIGGKVFGSSSKTTKRSAAAGALVGGARQSSSNKQVEQERQQWEQQETANYTNNRNNYNRAYAACLEGRGYSVK
jgi:hypothetical protein